MKRSTNTILACTILLGAAGSVAAQSTKSDSSKRAGETTPMTMPAVPDGSNASRAPAPAARPLDDVMPPNGEAFDHKLAPTPPTAPTPPSPAPSASAMFNPTSRAGTNAAATALQAKEMEMAIRNANYETRDRFVEDVRSRVLESRKALAAVHQGGTDGSVEVRAAFKAAMDDAKEREKTLERSLRAAQHAKTDNWEAARAQVSADFDAYVAALAKLDSATTPVR